MDKLIVKVQSNELQELSRLFATEQKAHEEIFFWQDRTPDFLSPYRLFQSGPADYIGVKTDGGWIACGGEVPMSVNFSDFKSRLILETDFMVHAQMRHRSLSAEMAKRRIEDFVKSGSANSLHWGVEHLPGSFTFSERLASTNGCEYVFRWQSNLHQVFLTDAPPAPAAEATLLKEASPEQRDHFFAEYGKFAQAKVFSAKIDAGIFSRILAADPEAQLISAGSAGAILLSGEGLNRYRFTGRSTVLLERIRRRRGLSTLKDEVFRLGLLTLSWYREDAPLALERVLQQGTRESYLRGFDCLALRDEPAEYIPQLSPDILSFPRRVFLVAGPQNPEFARIHQWLADANPQVKIDVASL